MAQPELHRSAEAIADRIVEALDGRIVLGLPLGLGKAGRIANALYRRASADSSISLDIFTALTLEPPSASSDMERRFIEPFVERFYADYERLDYAEALRESGLPDNIRVSEFFLQAGRWLGVPVMQQHYVSANYTHAAAMLLDKGVNVIAQLVARRDLAGATAYSLSSNTDITLDILPALRQRKQRFILAGEVSQDLPFMGGQAVLEAAEFDHVLDTPESSPELFAVPKQPISDADHAIGIHAASLVKDGGTIQIGIGTLGDAFTAALIMRHRSPDLFAETLRRLCHGKIPQGRHTQAFEQGLYGASEMFVDGFMELYRAGILKRRAGDGALLHAGFFLGSKAFYRFLSDLREGERDLFQMRGISYVNELFGDEDARRRDRVDARFVNSTMMATLLGDAVSDGLEDGQVVSGVGGQYNFVAQAFALDGARSIMTLNATRNSSKGPRSRILWTYGHSTVPRHLRDVFITEYGVADLRGRNDRDCVTAMLGLADARFQQGLLGQAKKSKKIESGYHLPEMFARNRPETISAALGPARKAGYCAPFVFDSGFTPVEQDLLVALSFLKEKTATPKDKLVSVISALTGHRPSDAHADALDRMRLDEPRDVKQRLARRLLCWALDRTRTV